jgi:hypothetical protein
MKNAAESDIDALASKFRVTVPALQGLLERSRGREAHNWVEDVLAGVSADRQYGLRCLAQSAIKVATADGSLQQFKERLREAGMLTESDI